MDKSILFLSFVALASFLIYNSKDGFEATNLMKVYSNESIPRSCDFTNENRPYPSGKVPGSYLGLSPQERETLLKRFVDYKKPSDDEFAPFES